MIVVSHRAPYRFVPRDDGTFDAARGAGGVVSGFVPLLAGPGPALRWIAAAIGEGDRAALRAGAARVPGVDLRLIDLDERMHRLHYDVVSNGVLWFSFHGLFDLVRRPRFDARFREAWDAYVAVNREFARAVVDGAERGDTVLVQDYQLALVPAFVRAERDDLRLVTFVHTPFANPDEIRVLPDEVARSLCDSLASGHLGFHTARWGRAFTAAAAATLGTDVGDRVFAASLGPDASALEEVAASDAARAAAATLDDTVGDRLVVLRTDRIEPSKNIVRGFVAFERVLELRPELRGRVVFVAMLYASRMGLPDYIAYASEVEQAVTRVNDRFASDDWTPVVLDTRDDFARSVAGLQRYDVLLVNPVRDGLNLVCKEGPVLNRRDGVVCLSREAGAHEELASEVETVHPFDIEQTAAALDRALAMTADERAVRAGRLRNLALLRTPARWLDDILAHA